MGFSLRLAPDVNLAWCASIMEDGFERRPYLHRMLPRIWADLLACDALSMIEIDEEASGKPVAFGAGVVVSDACAEAARRRTVPNLAVDILERELTGDRWILRPAEIRQVNHPRHGVNLCVLHYSEVMPGRSFAEFQHVRDKSVGALLRTQCGYAIREWMMEFYGVEDVAFMTRMGARIRTDYAAYLASGAEPLPRPARQPFLMGLSAEEMADQWGCPLATLFAYESPQIFFTLTQQRVLIRASRNPTPNDGEIAKALGVQRSTLREHWRGIFARVAAAQSRGLIPTAALPHFSEPSPELRSALLAYVNEHPCELRPADARHFTFGRNADQPRLRAEA